MYDAIKDKVKELLTTEQIKGFLALKNENGQIKPHLFVSPDELDQLSIGDGAMAGDARYPLSRIMTTLLQNHSEANFGILVRGCDQRALRALDAWNQIPLEQIVVIGVACSEELAQACKCALPYPDEWLEGEQGEPQDPRPVEWEEKDLLQRLEN